MFRLLQSLPESVEIGQPRLVRLWPFAHRRTRGNAAVAVELKPRNEDDLIDFLNQYWNNILLPLQGDVEESNHNDRRQYPADPGMVWFSDVEPNDAFYRKGLTEEIQLHELPIATKMWGGHGRIGATLAVHWPCESSTYEAIGWRMDGAVGERCLDENAIALVDQMDGTFLCRDGRLGTSILAPRGASPVLFGVRTWTMHSARVALETLLHSEGTEQVAGSMIFETNQATNDHLVDIISVKIESIEVLKGGHTLLRSPTNRFMAFKESGEIATICQQLRVGDIFECRGMKAPDGSIHIEFLRVVHLEPDRTRPLCPTCDKAMTSMGRNQGLRCKKCGFQRDDAWEESFRSLPINEWIQPPPSSRRHLAKPLDGHPVRQNNL